MSTMQKNATSAAAEASVYDPLNVEDADTISNQLVPWWRKRKFYVFIVTGVVLLVVAMAGVFAFPGPVTMQPEDLIGLSTASAELSNSDKVNILYYTNWDRCMHNALPLVWSPTIAWSAQKQVDRHGFQHSQGSKYGENLAYASTPKVRSMVDMWYQEVKHTSGGRVSRFGMDTGHYSQLVWKGTTKTGCGMKGAILNCQYSEAGNMQGAFRRNVGGPKFSSSSCKGAGHSEYSRSYGTPKSGDKWQIKETCRCTDVCRHGGQKYLWCHTSGCGHGGHNPWGKCTSPSNGAPKKKGCSCKSICDYGKRDKAWCYFYDQKACGAKWGDCTPA